MYPLGLFIIKGKYLFLKIPIVIEYIEMSTAIFSYSIVLTAVNGHMIRYNLNWSKIS